MPDTKDRPEDQEEAPARAGGEADEGQPLEPAPTDPGGGATHDPNNPPPDPGTRP